MKRTAREFRAAAWKALDGRYWWAVLATLIASVLGGTSSGGSAGFSSSYRVDPEHLRNFHSNIRVQLPEELVRLALIIGGAIASVMILVGIALFLIGGAVELGYDRFNVRLYESGERPELSELFAHFSIFGRALWLRVLMTLKTLAWMLLFIVPGIIAAYRYVLAPYLMAENPELTASEAIEKSKAMMNGNKGRLFCLYFSFIGWYLLAMLTAGIGFIFLAPYVKAAEAAFYAELSGKLPLEAAQAQPAQPVVVQETAAEGGPEQL